MRRNATPFCLTILLACYWRISLPLSCLGPPPHPRDTNDAAAFNLLIDIIGYRNLHISLVGQTEQTIDAVAEWKEDPQEMMVVMDNRG